MSATERPVGRRYSHLYLEPDEPLRQSIRLQARVASFFASNYRSDAREVATALNEELGAKLYYSGFVGVITKYLESASSSDFLEALTVISWQLADHDADSNLPGNIRLQVWIDFVERAMREENFAFEIDRAGGIHPRVDAGFATDRSAAIQGLAGGRYVAAREHFEIAHESLGANPPGTNRAIRELFLATEEVFRMVLPSAKKLDGTEITTKLNPLIAARFEGAERDALMAMSRAAVDYVSGSHQYRHAQGEPEKPPASMQTATFMMGMGTGFLRWLIWLDSHDRGAEA